MPPPSASLNFQMQTQQEDNWCWAAVAVSVSHYYDLTSSWTQCSLANRALPPISLVNPPLPRCDCCTNGKSRDCDRYFRLDTPLLITGNLNSMVVGPVPFNGVVGEISNDRPLACRMFWRGRGAHFVVLYGCAGAPYGPEASNWVRIQDPKFGFFRYRYGRFARNYLGGGVWEHSYYTQPQP